MQSKRFRHTAGFGKRIEYWIIGRMLKEGRDVYVPLVDDHAVDGIIKRPDGSIAQIQIKARSAEVIEGDSALFAAILHGAERKDYWFIFYSERLDLMWIMSSAEFLAEAITNKTGKNIGLRGIWFNGKRRDRATGKPSEYCKPRFERYLATDFSKDQECLLGVRRPASRALTSSVPPIMDTDLLWP